MQRLSILKVWFYLMVKYIVFFLVLGFFGERYKTMVLDKAKSSDKVFAAAGYFIEILFATFFLTLILFVPLYLVLKLKKIFYVLPAFLMWVTVEYFVYEATCSYIHFDADGIINGVISIVFFFVFFWKYLFRLHSNYINK